MRDPQLSVDVDPEELVFQPQQPPRPLRRVLDASFDLFLFVLLVVLIASGTSGPLLVIAAIALAVGWLMRIAAWASRRRDPGARGSRPRREIVRSASLVGRVRSLQRQNRGAEAAKLLRGETDLSLADTARALRLVRETGESQ